jgi:hypothetical protein
MNKVIFSAGAALGVMLVVTVFWGCSSRKLMVAEMTAMMETGAAAMESDDDLTMLQQALPANIKLMEAMLASDPQNERLLVLLARLYGSYAFLFLDGPIEALQSAQIQPAAGAETAVSLNKRATRYYSTGLEYALQALEIGDPLAADRLYRVTDSASFVQSLSEKDLPALFWYGFNLSGLINHNRDSVVTIASGHLVEKSMRRVLELQPDFYHGSAHLVLMVYYASRSPLMGGNLGRAQQHYEQLKTLHGDRLLLTDLFYARYVLVLQQDRRQFEQILAALLADSDSDPRFRLFNRVARDRARVYLSMADRLFEGG